MAEANITLRFGDDGTLRVVDEAGRKLAEVGRAADDSGGRAESAFRNWRGVITDVNQGIELLTRAYRGFVAVTSAPLEAASTVQSLETRLISLKDSEEAARESYERFARISATTPFELRNVVEAGVTLEAFGANADSTLKAVVDLAAFMGTDAVTASQAVGRAWAAGAGAADVLRERGVLALVQTRAGVEDLTKLSLPEFRQALFDAMVDPAGRIEGSTDRLSRTWQGLTSNISDALFGLNSELGKTVTESEAMREGAVRVAGEIRGLAGNVEEWVTANRGLIDQKIEDVFAAIEKHGPGAAQAIADMATELANLAVQAKDLVTGDNFFTQFFSTVSGGLSDAAELTSIMTDALRGAPSLAEAPNFGDFFSGDAPPELQARFDRLLLGTSAQDRLTPEEARSRILAGGSSTSLVGGQSLAGFVPGGRIVTRAPGETGPPDFGQDATGAEAEFQNRIAEHQAALKGIESEQESILGIIQMQADAAAEFAEQDLRRARERGASEQELLAIAEQVTAAERARLQAQIDALETEREFNALFMLDQATADELTARIGILRQEMARLPDHATDLARELEEAKVVTLDLADTGRDALRRAFDFGRGGGIGDLLEGTGERIFAEFSAGLAESILFKETFDAQIGENFTVTLPGFVASGMESITSIWSQGLDVLLRDSEGTTRGIGGLFSSLGDLAVSVGRNTPLSVLGFGGGTFSFGGGGVPVGSTAAEAVAGQSFAAGQSLARGGASSSGSVLGSGAGAAGGLAGAGGLGLATTGLLSGGAFLLADVGQGIGGGLPSGVLQASGGLLLASGGIAGAANAGLISSSGALAGIGGGLGLAGLALGGAGLGSLAGGFAAQELGKQGSVEGALISGAISSLIGGLIFPGIGLLLGGVLGGLTGGLFAPETRGTLNARAFDKLIEKSGFPIQAGEIDTPQSGPLSLAQLADIRAAGFGEFASTQESGLIRQRRRVSGQVLASQQGIDFFSLSDEEQLALTSQALGLTEAERQALFRGDLDLSDVSTRPGSLGGIIPGALGVGVALRGVAGNAPGEDAASFAATLTNRAAAVGLSEREQRRQLRNVVDQTGLTLFNSTDQLQRAGLDGATVEQLRAAWADLVPVFQDELPAGLDLVAIGFEHIEEAGGRAMVQVADLNEAARNQIDLFQGFQSAVLGLPGQLLSGQGSIEQSLVGALRSGIETRFLQTIPDEALAPINTALESAVLAALSGDRLLAGTNLAAATGSARDLMSNLAPAIEIIDEFTSAFETSSFGFEGIAQNARDRVQGLRVQTVAPSFQLDFVRDEVRSLQQQLDAASDPQQRADLLGDLGFFANQLVQVAGSRFAPGSPEYRQAIGEAIAVYEQVGVEADRFAGLQRSMEGLESSVSGLDSSIQALRDTIVETVAGAAPAGAAPGAGSGAAGVGRAPVLSTPAQGSGTLTEGTVRRLADLLERIEQKLDNLPVAILPIQRVGIDAREVQEILSVVRRDARTGELGPIIQRVSRER